MATVDLDALATALRAAGWEGSVTEHDLYPSLDMTSEDAKLCVFGDGLVGWNGDCDWPALDIIRRAVSPSAPEGLRNRIAGALESLLSEDFTTTSDVLADAVLAVLPPAPRVDEITIPRELAERAMGYTKYFADTAAAYDDHVNANNADADAAAIRAMLEGTA